MSFFEWKKPGTLGIVNRILPDMERELFKTHKTRTVLENSEMNLIPTYTPHSRPD